MLYLEGLFVVIAFIALASILIGAIKNVRGPRKGKYRYSWFEKKH